MTVLTPRQLQEVGERLYGYRWRMVLSKRLRRGKRVVDRWAAGDTTMPADLAVRLRELILEHMAALGADADDLGHDAAFN